MILNIRVTVEDETPEADSIFLRHVGAPDIKGMALGDFVESFELESASVAGVRSAGTISKKKLIALLDRLVADHEIKISDLCMGGMQNEANRHTGAKEALSQLKKDIVEHHHDLEAEL